MEKLSKGYVQVYTGDGKGKTTAALGQGLRAAGDGLKVYMVQFLKGGETGELKSVKKLEPDFEIFRFERPRGFFWTLNDKEKIELKRDIDKSYDFCVEALKNHSCDILILDEIMGVIQNKLLTEDDVLRLMEMKPSDVELIMTGRNVPQSIVERADLVTEMREVKHYFKNGVEARKGIEW